MGSIIFEDIFFNESSFRSGKFVNLSRESLLHTVISVRKKKRFVLFLIYHWANLINDLWSSLLDPLQFGKRLHFQK